MVGLTMKARSPAYVALAHQSNPAHVGKSTKQSLTEAAFLQVRRYAKTEDPRASELKDFGRCCAVRPLRKKQKHSRCNAFEFWEMHCPGSVPVSSLRCGGAILLGRLLSTRFPAGLGRCIAGAASLRRRLRRGRAGEGRGSGRFLPLGLCGRRCGFGR